MSVPQLAQSPLHLPPNSAALVDPAVAARSGFQSRAGKAIEDLVAGLRCSWLWTTLAQQDITLRYRGSLLGPFWQTLSTAVMIGGMGLIWSTLFHTPLEHYLPLLTLGLVVWIFVAGLVTEGCGTFTSVSGIIQQVKLPFSLHAYRLVYRNVLTLAHNFVIVPIVLYLFPQPIDWGRLWEIVPALVLIIINGIWVSILLGMVCARYRDVPPIVSSLVQVLFFITPVVWPLSNLGGNAWWAQLNPFFAAIDVIRSPLMGEPASPLSWSILIVTTLLTTVLSFVVYARLRHRLAFWV